MQGLSPEQQKQLILSVGVQRSRRPLTPIEVARLIQKAIEAGSTAPDLARFLHLSGPTMISRFVRLLLLPMDLQHLIDWGHSESTIGFTAASELSRLANHDEQRLTITAALENQLASAEIKQIVQARVRSGRDIQTCITEILGMRPHVDRIHVFIGAITSAEVRRQLTELTQYERDSLVGEVIRGIYPDLGKVAARLGVEKFTISGAEATAAALKGQTVDFETAINNGLIQKLDMK